MGNYPVRVVICLCWCFIHITAGYKGSNPEIVIPQKVNASGRFLTYRIPHHWTRSSTEDELVHYLVHLDDAPHHLQLLPNRNLVSPFARIESHRADGVKVIRKVRDAQCHFTGHVKGMPGSRVAVSTCNGLSGHIRTSRGNFVIEPHEEPSNDTGHRHLVYKHQHSSGKPSEPLKSNCETRGNQNSQAHDLFVQESIGRPLYLSIVRIIRLDAEDNEINLSLVKNPCTVLVSFQKWQNHINPGNDMDPNHHDLAILITKVDIYAEDDNRDLLGIAHQAGVCDPRHQGIICEDVGLLLGYVVTHEIGHALGFLHDLTEESGCNSTLPNGLNTVMGPRINISTGDWSMCSHKYLTIFVDSGMGHCLFDHPSDHPFNYVDELPGVVYDAEWQCRSKFGSSSSLCDTAPRCDTLFCQVPDEGCIDTHIAPADGTTCGDNKWCYHGECLQKGMRPGSRDGGWGPWSPWSKCTRTCGTGVSSAERRCDSPQPAQGGEFCKGPKKKYRICNAEPCPVGLKFRESQCAKFDAWVYPEDKQTHKWRAAHGPVDDPCALYCVNEDNTVANLQDRVIDGTNCMRGIRDICIAGKCVTIPCDLNMDSGAVEDVCGVCRGDGTTCTLKEGFKFFHPPDKNLEANRTKDEIYKLIDIPEGSQNIHVEETEPTTSRIEVRDQDGNFVYVEGDEFGLFEVPGSRAWLGFIRAEQETLHIPGPVSEPLSIWVSPMQNVTFEYSLAVQTDKRQGAFEWDYVEWTPCTAHCGTGTSMSYPRCIEQSSGEVDDQYCEGVKPLIKVMTCESLACAPRWLIGEWEKCSKRRRNAEPGQERLVRCVRPTGSELSDLVIIKPSNCPEPKPIDYQSCYLLDNKGCGASKEKRKIMKRKVFHRPNRLHSKTSKKIYVSPKTANLPRKQRHTEEEIDYLASQDEEVRKLTLERGKVNIDRVLCSSLKLTIKEELTNWPDTGTTVTIRTLYDKEVEEEMEKIRRNNPKIDKI